MSVLAYIQIQAKQGRGKELINAFNDPLIRTREQSECLEARLFADTEDGDRLLLIEVWTSAEAHNAYVASLVTSGGLEPLMSLMAGPPTSAHFSELASDQELDPSGC